jgi:endonuclease/exonuclease/phosphatase family metal-dependent hydrolase
VRLRVASFNIHHGVGLDRRLDLERTAALIRSTGAEVIGLQEVDRHLSGRSGRIDQPGWLAGRLGMEVAYGANIDLDPDDPDDPAAPRRHYGNAVLSAHPLRRWRNVPLPVAEGAEPRGVVEATVSIGGTDVRVAATHLQNRSPRERYAQAMTIVDVVRTGQGPAVLLGDMNASPDSPEIGVLTAALVDAWATVGVGAGLTFDADTPHDRIDYVMTTRDVAAQAAWLVPTDASDHLPVVADLRIPGGSAVP